MLERSEQEMCYEAKNQPPQLIEVMGKTTDIGCRSICTHGIALSVYCPTVGGGWAGGNRLNGGNVVGLRGRINWTQFACSGRINENRTAPYRMRRWDGKARDGQQENDSDETERYRTDVSQTRRLRSEKLQTALRRSPGIWGTALFPSSEHDAERVGRI